MKKNIALEKYETAEKVCCIFKGVYDYAYERNLLSEENLSIILRLQKLSRKIPNSREKTLYQVMTDAEIGELMLKLANYDQSYLQVQIAIKLAPYLALRSGELCNLEWDDVDLERKEIVIPAHKMKMKHEHLVPLSSQAVALLEQLPRVDSFLFCSIKKPNKPISTNALIMALRKMGYKSNSHSKDVFCTHGFRGMFSTLLHQHKHFKDFSSDVIEFQLAHTEKNKVKNSYNRTHLRSYFEERQQMMQMYANFLDELREKADKH